MVEALAISQILLWILVLGSLALNLVLMRQVGVLFERVAPAGALATNAVLEKGSQVPYTEYPSLDHGAISLGGASETDRDTLVLFVAPDCPVCKSIVPAALSMAQNERNSLSLVFASAGDTPSEHRKYIKAQDLGDHPYVLSDDLGISFGVAKLPYAVLITSKGEVASFGLVNTREHLESLVEARERGVVSLQEYMGRAPAQKA